MIKILFTVAIALLLSACAGTPGSMASHCAKCAHKCEHCKEHNCNAKDKNMEGSSMGTCKICEESEHHSAGK